MGQSCPSTVPISRSPLLDYERRRGNTKKISRPPCLPFANRPLPREDLGSFRPRARYSRRIGRPHAPPLHIKGFRRSRSGVLAASRSNFSISLPKRSSGACFSLLRLFSRVPARFRNWKRFIIFRLGLDDLGREPRKEEAIARYINAPHIAAARHRDRVKGTHCFQPPVSDVHDLCPKADERHQTVAFMGDG